MTTPTPMMMPSIVSAVRILLLARPRRATRRLSLMFISGDSCRSWRRPALCLCGRGFNRPAVLLGGDAGQHVGGPEAPAHRFVFDHAPVPDLHHALAVAADIRLVRDHDDRPAVLVHLLEDLHDLFALHAGE